MAVSFSESKRVDQDRVVRLLVDLCRTDSAPLKEKKLFDRVWTELQELGFDLHEDDAARKTGSQTGNILARRAGSGDRANDAPLMFSAHLDRVEGGVGVRPVVEDGFVKSGGDTILGADDAAGLAAILEACRALVESGASHPPLELVITVGEEVGLVGAKAVDVSSLESRMGWVLDADGAVGTIVCRTPTQYTIKAEIHGRSAHAGIIPERGVSAIKIAAAAISRMKLGRIDGDTTANVGYIAGGGPTNIVPDRAEFHAETRSLVREKVERQLEAMRSALFRAAEAHGGKAQWEAELAYEAFDLPPDSGPVRRAAKAAESLGLVPRLTATGGGSDANVFNAKGLPCAVLGVGYQGIHSFEERMPISELVRLAELVLAIILQRD